MQAEDPDCSTNQADLVNSIIQEINSQNILIIPSSEPVKVLRSFQTKAMDLIKIISLITITENGSITALNITFRNLKDFIFGEPLILPDIPAHVIISEIHDEPIQLHSVDLQKIKLLKQTAVLTVNSRKPRFQPPTWNIS